MNFFKRLTPKSIKRVLIYKIIMPYRLATAKKRALPNFIIIGAQKSGTTSLHNYLSQHPQLLAASRKEVQYFDGGLIPEINTFKKGENWYRSHFPLIKKLGKNCQTFDANPNYIFNPVVPKRIFKLIPNAKLVVVLRNPTERAISHYFHMERKNFDTLPMLEAMKEEENRLKEILEHEDYKNRSFRRHSYKLRGHYKEQIERYLKYFSKEQIHIISSEEFFNHPEKALKNIFNFIGVDSSFKVKDLKPKNVSENRNKVNNVVYSYLDSYFSTHNKALFNLIEKKFDW